MRLAQVADNPQLVRDLDSKALLNTDMEGLSAYKKRRMASHSTEIRLSSLETKMDQLIELIKEKL